MILENFSLTASQSFSSLFNASHDSSKVDVYIITFISDAISSSTTMDKNYGKTAKNGVVLDTTSNVKLFLETIWSG